MEEEKLVDIVVGPDSYRELPNLIKEVDFCINQLSDFENQNE